MPVAREPAVPRRRTALAQRGGSVRRTGDTVFAGALAEALAAAGDETDRWTHGFHVYPARMHPGVASVLCGRFAGPGTTVLDPFCGSGTVLLEAVAGGARAIGSDLNPLALRLAALKCTRVDAAARRRLAVCAAEITERTLAGVRARVDIRAPLPPSERAYYQSHVLRELAVLHHEIGRCADPFEREALMLVFSSLVVKFSRQRADTRDESVEKHIGKGIPTRFFARKAEELVARLAALDVALPTTAIPPRLMLGDARKLIDLVGRGCAELVLTSPPYVGTYDYSDLHARRWPWLGIVPKRLRANEIGSRRDHTDVRAHERWVDDLMRVLDGMAHALAPGGFAMWMVGDGEIGGQRIAADAQLRELAPRAGLEVIATASQPRTDWRGHAPREEHLVAMRAGVSSPRRGPAPRRSPPPGRPHRR